MGLIGILLGLGLLIFLAFRGWSILLLAPAAALVAALLSGQPLLAHWTQTFMLSAAHFLAQFFPIFLLGALFGKLMEDSGSVTSIANFMVDRLGEKRAILAVVLAGAIVTYGGVSLFVAFFVLAPMATVLFRNAGIPRRLMPAALMLVQYGFDRWGDDYWNHAPWLTGHFVFSGLVSLALVLLAYALIRRAGRRRWLEDNFAGGAVRKAEAMLEEIARFERG